MVSFPQPCGQDAYRDGTSVVTALSRQGLNAPGTGAILHSAGAVVTPAVTQCLGFSVAVIPWLFARRPTGRWRVFLLGDVELCNNWGTATNRNLHTGQQVVTKQVVKAEFRLDLASLMVQTLGSGQVPHVQQMLAEIIENLAVTKEPVCALPRPMPSSPSGALCVRPSSP